MDTLAPEDPPQTPEPAQLTLDRMISIDFHLDRVLRDRPMSRNIHLYLSASGARNYTETALLNLAMVANKARQHRRELFVTFFDHKILTTVHLETANYTQLVTHALGRMLSATVDTGTPALKAWRDLLEKHYVPGNEVEDLEQVWQYANAREHCFSGTSIVATALVQDTRSLLVKHPRNLYYLDMGANLSPETPEGLLDRETLLRFIERLGSHLRTITINPHEDRVLNYLSDGDIAHACGTLNDQAMADTKAEIAARTNQYRQAQEHDQKTAAVGELWNTLRTSQVPRWGELDAGTQEGIHRLVGELKTNA